MKQAIQNATQKLFANNENIAISMRDIAQLIGKQKGGLY